VSVRVLPLEGLPEIRPGDDLAALLALVLREVGAQDGDVVAVTQKVVSKAEGRIVPDDGSGRDAWVRRETVRVVARRGDLIQSLIHNSEPTRQ
jgi:coenzyme F420-0:L-glutamate ligase/coenzyme F420-1:gamma-L-glutamate ligase